jgi:hypothetical protein
VSEAHEDDYVADYKIQRSFYMTEDQARWLKIRSAERGMTASALICELIDTARIKAKPERVMPKS